MECVSSPGEAMSSSHNILVSDERASTEKAAVLLQADLPGPRPRIGVFAPYDPRVERCHAANWKEMVSVKPCVVTEPSHLVSLVL